MPSAFAAAVCWNRPASDTAGAKIYDFFKGLKPPVVLSNEKSKELFGLAVEARRSFKQAAAALADSLDKNPANPVRVKISSCFAAGKPARHAFDCVKPMLESHEIKGSIRRGLVGYLKHLESVGVAQDFVTGNPNFEDLGQLPQASYDVLVSGQGCAPKAGVCPMVTTKGCTDQTPCAGLAAKLVPAVDACLPVEHPPLLTKWEDDEGSADGDAIYGKKPKADEPTEDQYTEEFLGCHLQYHDRWGQCGQVAGQGFCASYTRTKVHKQEVQCLVGADASLKPFAEGLTKMSTDYEIRTFVNYLRTFAVSNLAQSYRDLVGPMDEATAKALEGSCGSTIAQSARSATLNPSEESKRASAKLYDRAELRKATTAIKEYAAQANGARGELSTHACDSAMGAVQVKPTASDMKDLLECARINERITRFERAIFDQVQKNPILAAAVNVDQLKNFRNSPSDNLPPLVKTIMNGSDAQIDAALAANKKAIQDNLVDAMKKTCDPKQMKWQYLLKNDLIATQTVDFLRKFEVLGEKKCYAGAKKCISRIDELFLCMKGKLDLDAKQEGAAVIGLGIGCAVGSIIMPPLSVACTLGFIGEAGVATYEADKYLELQKVVCKSGKAGCNFDSVLEAHERLTSAQVSLGLAVGALALEGVVAFKGLKPAPVHVAGAAADTKALATALDRMNALKTRLGETLKTVDAAGLNQLAKERSELMARLKAFIAKGELNASALEGELTLLEQAEKDLAELDSAVAASVKGTSTEASAGAQIEKAIADENHGFTADPKSPKVKVKSVASYDPLSDTAGSLKAKFHDPAFAKKYVADLREATLKKMLESGDPAAVALAKEGKTSEEYVLKVLEDRFKKRGWNGHFEVKDCCADTADLQKRVLQKARSEKKFFLDPIQAKSTSNHGVYSHALQFDMGFEAVGEADFMEILDHVANPQNLPDKSTVGLWEELFDASAKGDALNNPAVVQKVISSGVTVK